MRARDLAILLVISSIFFVASGAARIICLVRPDVVVIAYGISVIIVGFIVWLLLTRHDNALAKFVILGCLLGFVADVSSVNIFDHNEEYDSRLLEIEKQVMQFQTDGCRPLQNENLFISRTGDSQAVIISAWDSGKKSYLISEESYKQAQRVAHRPGLFWLFGGFAKSVYLWSFRPVVCERKDGVG